MIACIISLLILGPVLAQSTGQSFYYFCLHFFFFFLISFFFLSFYCFYCNSPDRIPGETIELQLNEAFVIPLHRVFFFGPNFEDVVVNTTSSVSTSFRHENFRLWAQQQNRPDLPSWIRLKHCSGCEYAYLYGSPTRPGLFRIELIVHLLSSYDSRVLLLQLRVQPRRWIACNHVQIKLLNLDIEDLLHTRIESLLEIFAKYLWPIDDKLLRRTFRTKRVQSKPDQSNQIGDQEIESSVQHLSVNSQKPIYLSSILSIQDAGLRLPVDPNQKIGVLIQIGGVAPFSDQLILMNRELQPLRQLRFCPPDYRASSAEHLFRARKFVVDWCHFDLIHDKCGITNTSNQKVKKSIDMWRPNQMNVTLSSLVTKADHRNYHRLIAVNLAVISLLGSLLFVTLICASCS